MDKASKPEVIRVNDLIGLVSRKVKSGPITPTIRDQASTTKAPPTPLAPTDTSFIARALSVYNGWIPLDTWLNSHDTTWNQCFLVARVLSGPQKYALAYLAACDFSVDMKTAGYMRGQIAAMEGICLLRQIFKQIQQHGYAYPSDVKEDVTRFMRFINSTADIPTVISDMHTIVLSVESMDEFKMRWFSTFVPVNNMIHVRRIFKTRVKKVVLNECLSVLHQRQWDANFSMYYFLGVMSRLDTFDLNDPYWNEDTLRPLRQLFFLFSQVAVVDFSFARQVFPALIPILHYRQTMHLEEIYLRFIAWLLYKSALKEKDIFEVVEMLCIWEKQLAISIKSHPQVLIDLYREMPFYDLAFAEREVRKVVVIVDHVKH